MGALPPNPGDLSLCCRNGDDLAKAGVAALAPFRPPSGAPVASLRSRTLRPGAINIPDVRGASELVQGNPDEEQKG
jgi:hypothetical protein